MIPQDIELSDEDERLLDEIWAVLDRPGGADAPPPDLEGATRGEVEGENQRCLDGGEG